MQQNLDFHEKTGSSQKSFEKQIRLIDLAGGTNNVISKRRSTTTTAHRRLMLNIRNLAIFWYGNDRIYKIKNIKNKFQVKKSTAVSNSFFNQNKSFGSSTTDLIQRSTELISGTLFICDQRNIMIFRQWKVKHILM